MTGWSRLERHSTTVVASLTTLTLILRPTNSWHDTKKSICQVSLCLTKQTNVLLLSTVLTSTVQRVPSEQLSCCSSWCMMITLRCIGPVMIYLSHPMPSTTFQSIWNLRHRLKQKLLLVSKFKATFRAQQLLLNLYRVAQSAQLQLTWHNCRAFVAHSNTVKL